MSIFSALSALSGQVAFGGIACIVVLVVVAPLLPQSVSEIVRNRIKGQPSGSTKGQKVSWKKDCDPAVPEDANPVWVMLDMAKWTFLASIGRWIMSKLYPPPNLNYYDVKDHPGVHGLVALTVDDCFCRQSEEHSMIPQLRELTAKYGAKLTFFLTSDYSKGEWRERAIAELVRDGHELANHCQEDREYDTDSAESFEAALDDTNAFIKRMTPNSPLKWFRAPSGNVSNTMHNVLAKKGMTNAMVDCYSNDPHVPRAEFIAATLCRFVKHGSIMVVHMPERGFREWDFRAIELTLVKLKERGLRSVTLTELATAAEKKSQ